MPAAPLLQPFKEAPLRARQIALVGLFLLVPGFATAQGNGGRRIKVIGTRALTFGNLIAGVPGTVLRTDPASAGQFDLTAQNNNVVILAFTLPVVMTSASGKTMPISFAGNDAGFSQAQAINDQVAFDPRLPYLGTMSKTGRATIFLGGTTSPTFNQSPGNYSATITLTLVYP